jgi:hypothetical protein
MFNYVNVFQVDNILKSSNASFGRRIALFNRSISLVTIVATLGYATLQPVRRGKGRLGLPASPESYRH